MDALLQELTGGIPNYDALIRVIIRVVLAAAFGGAIGWQRRKSGHAAGLRTHMIVCLGAAIFVIAIIERGGTSSDISRVIQGIVTGIGFLGAGTILKLDKAQQVKGLTTAADIWITAGIGTAVGAGLHALALLGTILTWFILAYLYLIEERATKTQLIDTTTARPPSNDNSSHAP